MTSVWYQPHPLTSLQNAEKQLQSFTPHLAPVEIQGGGFAVTTGYAPMRVDVTARGINVFFSRNFVQQIQFLWLWGNGTAAPPYTPSRDDIVASIVYEDAYFFETWHYEAVGPSSEEWCIAPGNRESSRNPVLCARSQADAQALTDALATLVVASGVDMYTNVGINVEPLPEKEQQKHPKETGGKITGGPRGLLRNWPVFI